MSFRLGSRRVCVNASTWAISVSEDSNEIWKNCLKPEIRKLLELAEAVSENRLMLTIVYKRWKRCIDKVKNILTDAIEIMTKHCRNVVIAEACGSSASAAGSVVAITGFALALPTVGLSLGLSIGGTAMSIVGGTVATGSSLVGKVLKKRLEGKAEKEYDIFKSRSEKLQKRCNEYTASLNEFFRLYTNTVIPCCTKVAAIENPSLVSKYSSENVTTTSVTPIDILISLAHKKNHRKDEVELLWKIKTLMTQEPCLSASYNEISSADFGLSVDEEETSICASIETVMKSAKATVGFVGFGSNTPTIVGKFINMSSDVADGFAKGAAIVGRTLSITFSSISLGFDLFLMGNAFWKLYGGTSSQTLERLKGLLEVVEAIEKNVPEALRPVKLTDDIECPSSKKKDT